MTDLPSEATIRGAAMNTAFSGNMFWFEADHVGALTSHKPVHFVVDHDRSIQSVAGETRFTHVSPSSNGDDNGVLLHFRADLSDEFNGFEPALKHIQALRSRGRVPNVSVSIGAEAIKFDEEKERLIMAGPYEVFHLGLVDVGAFNEETGVGVFDVMTDNPGTGFEQKLAASITSSDEGRFNLAGCTVNLHVMNMQDLVVDFVDKNLLDRPELVEMIGDALGQLEEGADCPNGRNEDGSCKDAPSSYTTEASTSMTGTNENAVFTYSGDWTVTGTGIGDTISIPMSPFGPQGPYKEDEGVGNKGSAEPAGNHMTDERETVDPQGAEPEADVSPAALSMEQVEDLLEQKLQDRDERIATLERERDEAREAVLSEARARVAEKADLSAEDLEGFSSEQLSVFEAKIDELTAKRNSIPRQFGRVTSKSEDDPYVKAFNEAKEWHESVYLGNRGDL